MKNQSRSPLICVFVVLDLIKVPEMQTISKPFKNSSFFSQVELETPDSKQKVNSPSELQLHMRTPISAPTFPFSARHSYLKRS